LKYHHHDTAMTNRTTLLASITLLALAGCARPLPEPAAPLSEHEARIERIERGLLTQNVVEGDPSPGRTIEERMRFYDTPGVSVAVIHDGRLVWARGYGVVEAGGTQPVDTATLFQAASISKPVAAIGALRLVEQGRLSLDDDANGWLRSWKVPENGLTESEKVTLRRLLSHSAGLTVHGFRGYAAGEPVPALVQLLDGEKPANSAAVRVDLLPGSRWRYSGGGTSVAQLMMEDVSGESFPALMQRLVLGPAGMVHSTYEQPLPAARAARAATGHRGDGSPVAGRWHTYPEMAAAGLWTTPSDLARLGLEVQRAARGEPSAILSRQMTHEMLTRQSGEYGIGFGVEQRDGGDVVFSHGGANEGFRAFFFAARDGGYGAAVMTNGDDGSALGMEILRGIAREYGWPVFQPTVKQTVSVDPAVYAELAGSYRLEFRGQTHSIVVSEADGALRAELPMWSRPRTLHPASAERYFFLDSGAELSFERNAEGVVEAVRVTGVGAPMVARRIAD
jgi:CubicO group peptidase (beta-lactamase class C family)